jgi:hypothetical protein
MFGPRFDAIVIPATAKLLGLGALPLIVADCGTHGCTLIGCGSTTTAHVASVVTETIPLPLTVTVCAEGCQHYRLERDDGGVICRPATNGDQFVAWECVLDADGGAKLWVPVRGPGSHALSVVATTDAGTQVFDRTGSIDVTASYPNGYECDKDNPCLQGATDVPP